MPDNLDLGEGAGMQAERVLALALSRISGAGWGAERCLIRSGYFSQSSGWLRLRF